MKTNNTISEQLLNQYRDSLKPEKDNSPQAQISNLKRQVRSLKVKLAEVSKERDMLANFIDEHTADQTAGEDY